MVYLFCGIKNYAYIRDISMNIYMKRLLLILLTAPLLMACGSDSPEVNNPKGKILPDQLVRIEAAQGVKVRAAEAEYTEDGERLLTALEVAKQGVILAGTYFYQPDTSLIWQPSYYVHGERAFGDNMRDTVSATPALLMYSEDILTAKGLYPTFLKGYDVLVLGKEKPNARLNEHGFRERDTIAYVPNSVLREAEKKIYKAYADSNYTEVYRLFHAAYKFRPITGKQWQRLKAAGKN